MYDFIIVGAGLFGATFVERAIKAGKRCLVIDRRAHIAGNCYTEDSNGIQVHKYGAHIFHTSNRAVWDYVNRFAEFNHYVNSPLARIGNELYNLPFNMNTFSRLWGTNTPVEAMAELKRQRVSYGHEPRNLKEQALSLVGHDIYEKLIKGYTEKQWQRLCHELPASIIKRIPLRFTFDNNYFNDRYQGIPIGGYTAMVEKMLAGADILLNTDYFEFIKETPCIAEKVVYTGPIDVFFDYCYGALEYRSLRFEEETLPFSNYQGNAVVNYTAADVLHTRIIEHKHFEFGIQPHTVITREYPAAWQPGDEPYYPINDQKNTALYERYNALANTRPEVIFGGRLGEYKYYDMDKVVERALAIAKLIIE